VASAGHVAVALSAEQTRALLQEVPPVYHTQINDVLLTALVQSFGRWTGERALLVDLDGHGREGLFEGVDLSRTVGWFTTLFPVYLELQAEEPGGALKAIKEQLRAIPQGGIGYGVLRYLHPDPEVRTALHARLPAEVSFNLPGTMGFDALGRRALSASLRVEWPAAQPLREAPSSARGECVAGRGPAAPGVELQPAGASAGHGGAAGAVVSGGLGGPYWALLFAPRVRVTVQAAIDYPDLQEGRCDQRQ
jgi:hypothetical protein